MSLGCSQAKYSLLQGPPPPPPPRSLSLPTLPPLHPPTTSPDLQYKLFIRCSGPEQGAQTARVQARSALILGMTCRPYYLSASLRHCHGQGLLHKAPGQRSRQKENVNPCPPESPLLTLGPTSCFQEHPSMTSSLANLTDYHSLASVSPQGDPGSRGQCYLACALS